MLFAPAAGHQPGSIIGRWWNDWRGARDSLGRLDGCGRDEVERIARDLAVTSGELRTLVRKGATAAKLVYRRMADLGLDEAALARDMPEIMRDLQKTCAVCASKQRCSRDFARGAPLSAWRAYCPNDGTLRGLSSQAPRTSSAAITHVDANTGADRAQVHTLGWAVLLVACAWLALNPMPQLVRPHVSAATASAPATPSERSALTMARAVQERGWINTSRAQADAAEQAVLETRRINAAEVLTCKRAGGSVYNGLMFQNGCTQGGAEAVRQAGYGSCRPLVGGGACLLN
jgi:hypothetical protein